MKSPEARLLERYLDIYRSLPIGTHTLTYMTTYLSIITLLLIYMKSSLGTHILTQKYLQTNL
jgi:hypothetical protein